MSNLDFSMINQLNMNATLAQAPASAPPLAGAGSGPVSESQQPLGTTGADGSGAAAPPQGNPFAVFFPIMLIFGVMIFLSIFSGRKEKRKRQEMLDGINKYDKVQTVGGLIGAVHEVRDNEITLKVDESTNTKVKISRNAVQTVLSKGPASRRSSTEHPADKNESLEAVAS